MLTLETWSPTRELDRMERRLRHLFDTVGSAPTVEPAVDIYETETEFVLELEVPGFDEKELAVEITDHALIVSGEHEQEAERKDQEFVLHERVQSRFSRRFQLPAASDTEHISAACEKGLLTLHVPKTAAEPVRKIDITKA